MVVGGGFEPPKALPTDLQSVPFGRSGTPPEPKLYYTSAWSQRRDSNPRPTDYKSVALPTELRWRLTGRSTEFHDFSIATCEIPDNLSSVNTVYEKTGQTGIDVRINIRFYA
jgi:hypothetical protein